MLEADISDTFEPALVQLTHRTAPSCYHSANISSLGD